MGRLAQKGLDYFPMDTTWEIAVKLLKAKYGALEGTGFLAELWASVYRENYYRKWDEENELLFADEINKPVPWVHEVIEYCFQKGIFDRTIYDAKGVLTSHGIQKRYFKIAHDSLGRSYIDYIDGITYPQFMKNNLGGKADNLQGNRDNLGGKDEIQGGKCNNRKQSKAIEMNSKQTAEQDCTDQGSSDLDKLEAPARSPAPALEVLRKKILGTGIPLSLSDLELGKIAMRFEDAEVREDELDPLMAYLADRTRREAKKNLAGLFKKALLEYDWISAFRDERPKPAETVAPTYPPPPECCDWAEVRTTHPGDVGRCSECGAVWSFDHKLGVWVKDSDEKKLENTG